MILLGSQSPRRRELLAGLDIDFECVKIDCEETFPGHLQGAGIPVYLAKRKADAYRHNLQPDDILITADTIVWCDNMMLGKPHDKSEACRMLHLLSGKRHEVITGVCLTTKQTRKNFAVVSKVRFAELDDAEIEYYVEKYRPYDKAGAYGIQEWIGYIGVESIVGSYFNVMGLPVQQLYKELKLMRQGLLVNK